MRSPSRTKFASCDVHKRNVSQQGTKLLQLPASVSKCGTPARSDNTNVLVCQDSEIAVRTRHLTGAGILSEPTLRNRVRVDKLTVAQPVKKFAALHEMQRPITLFTPCLTGARQLNEVQPQTNIFFSCKNHFHCYPIKVKLFQVVFPCNASRQNSVRV